MANFVLVPGFWLGGWAWRAVAEPLRAAGHTVYAVTLTGLGERVHLGGPQVDLETHVIDILNLLHYEDLHDVMLVGHSYGAVVSALVADRAPERIAHLICVDSAPLPDGVSMLDFNPPEVRATIAEQVATQGDGWRYPLPAWAQFEGGNDLRDLGEAERNKIRARSTDQPFASVQQPVHMHHAAWPAIPRTAIWCTHTRDEVQQFAAAYPALMGVVAEPDWQMVELPTGHWPMFSRPRELADLLASLA